VSPSYQVEWFSLFSFWSFSMYLNADHLPPETLLQNYDLCIVGAGAAGISFELRVGF
jgi:hypothetical protein